MFIKVITNLPSVILTIWEKASFVMVSESKGNEGPYAYTPGEKVVSKPDASFEIVTYGISREDEVSSVDLPKGTYAVRLSLPYHRSALHDGPYKDKLLSGPLVEFSIPVVMDKYVTLIDGKDEIITFRAILGRRTKNSK